MTKLVIGDMVLLVLPWGTGIFFLGMTTSFGLVEMGVVVHALSSICSTR